VVILDPCTGTGNFIVNLIERMPGKALAEAYQNRLFANEVMLLPYYVASLNIEHAYYERMKQYEPFPGLCFVDTLDMAEAKQPSLFTPANTERVDREKEAAITVIIGNPPYNVGQKSENDNNKNRKYKVVDERVREINNRGETVKYQRPLIPPCYCRMSYNHERGSRVIWRRARTGPAILRSPAGRGWEGHRVSWGASGRELCAWCRRLRDSGDFRGRPWRALR